MRDPWRFPDELVARAELIIGEDGQIEKEVSPSAPTVLAMQTGAPSPPHRPRSR